ncbi:MAG: ATP-binding cassette domain-containing protein [Treponema sp.]|nr:ATP-binding cassette domain-containing protein [Treponema sp.]
MIELKDITWDTPDGTPILKGINLTISNDKFIVITGPNGSGKTTLAKIIAGLEKPKSGQIYLNGTDITNLNVTERAIMGMSYAFQQPVRFKGITVRDMLNLASPRPLTEDTMADILEHIGLRASDYLDREINSSLSGGEIKRIEIATVFARHTKLTIFDEPEAGIDLWSFANLINIFKNLRESLNGSLIIISHQERIINIADEVVLIEDGKIQAQGITGCIMPRILGHNRACCKCPKGRENV